MLIRPINLEVQVKDIHVNDKPVPISYPGDIADVLITVKKDTDWMAIRKGCFLSSTKYQVPTTSRFLAQIKIYNVTDPILIGSRANFHLCGTVEGGVISKLRHTCDRKTKGVLKKNPRFLVSEDHAEVEITLDREACIELYDNFKSLGVFQMRNKGQSVGDGRIIRIIK